MTRQKYLKNRRIVSKSLKYYLDLIKNSKRLEEVTFSSIPFPVDISSTIGMFGAKTVKHTIIIKETYKDLI